MFRRRSFLKRRFRHRDSYPMRAAHQRRLRIEVLENRRLLATTTVTNNLDEVNGDTSSITALNANDGGDGISLREAIVAANMDVALDTINFNIMPPFIPLIVLTEGELPITESLAIEGPLTSSLIVSGGNNSRIFNIDSGSFGVLLDVTIAGVTLTEGRADVGGAIRSTEKLSLFDVTVINNQATSRGGGIFLRLPPGAEATIEDTTIDSNSVTGEMSQGGGIYVDNDGSFRLLLSVVQNNQSTERGGGMAVFNEGSATIGGSTFFSNTSGGDGGGISIQNESVTANTTIVGTTVSENRSAGVGTGVSATGNGGSLQINRSTISGNRPIEDTTFVSGLYVAAGPNASISNSTLSGNATRGSEVQAELAGTAVIRHSTINGIGGSSPAILLRVNSSLSLDHTIVVGSEGSRDISTFLGDIDNVSVKSSLVGKLTPGFNDLGGNIIGTSEMRIDAQLGPLDDNGGPTQTHALLPGSPAIDAGDVNFGGIPVTDQRGFDRVAGDFIDIGAYETNEMPTVIVDTPLDVVDPEDGLTSLREATIFVGNPGGLEIRFDESLNGQTIELLRGELPLLGPARIIGPAANLLTILGDNNSRIFYVENDTDDVVELTGLTLANGAAPDVGGNEEGGAIYGRGNITFDDIVIRDSFTRRDGGNGGGAMFDVRAGETVNINNSAFIDNWTQGNLGFGGGFAADVAQEGTLNVTDSYISGNSTNGGTSPGGGASISNQGTVNITRTRVENNHADGASSSGGGANILNYNGGWFAATDATVTGNTSARNGGGADLTNLDGTLTVANSSFSGNTSGEDGGAAHISTYNDNARFINSTVSGNNANNNGGGLTKTGSGKLTVAHSTFTLNVSDFDNSGVGAGGGIRDAADTVILDHVILAGNTDNTGIGPEAYGMSFELNFSIVGDNTGMTFTDNGGNKIGTDGSQIDPLLGPLQDNGGATETHALMAGSPALDMGDPNAVAGADAVPEFDQRGNGFPRVVDGNNDTFVVIDIGAYEYNPNQPDLLGDYNMDGRVNAADYVVWRNTEGDTVTPFRGADGNGNGVIDDGDYDVWRDNYGNTLPPGAASLAEGPISDVSTENQLTSAAALTLGIANSTTDYDPKFNFSGSPGAARLAADPSSLDLLLAANTIGSPKPRRMLRMERLADVVTIVRALDPALAELFSDHADSVAREKVFTAIGILYQPWR